MKAVVWTRYGPPDGLALKDVPRPVPKENELLIKVHAAGVTAGDCEMRSMKIPFWLALPARLFIGPLRPTRVSILGQELAGEIEAVGGAVTSFQPGEQVFGTTGFRFGAYAEYLCLPESAALARKPANLTYEQAAGVPVGGLEAWHFLRQANLQPGEKVLINGAGGSIGTLAIQLARHFGAEVTAVDSTAKLDMLLATGAEHVVDYTCEDFTQNGQVYDVIFDVVGKSSFSRSLQSLGPNGRYLLANPGLAQSLRGRWTSPGQGRKIIQGAASQTTEDLLFLKGLIEAGTLKPVVDRVYPLDQTAEAHRYVETGQKQGNVIIRVG